MILIGLNSHVTELILNMPSQANKMDLFSTTCNAPYLHLRLDLILELYRTFPIAISIVLITFFTSLHAWKFCEIFLSSAYFNPSKLHLYYLLFL